MAEGMDVDPAPVVRDKKRFEVKKVSNWRVLDMLVILVHVCSGMQWLCGPGVSAQMV